MLSTYTIPQITIAEIQKRLILVEGLSVTPNSEITSDDNDFEAIFDIDFKSQSFQLSVLKSSETNEPSLFKCWLFLNSGVNPLNPVTWFRWIVVERKQFNDLEKVLTKTIGLKLVQLF